jgi:hypothetical protein
MFFHFRKNSSFLNFPAAAAAEELLRLSRRRRQAEKFLKIRAAAADQVVGLHL